MRYDRCAGLETKAVGSNSKLAMSQRLLHNKSNGAIEYPTSEQKRKNSLALEDILYWGPTLEHCEVGGGARWRRNPNIEESKTRALRRSQMGAIGVTIIARDPREYWAPPLGLIKQVIFW